VLLRISRRIFTHSFFGWLCFVGLAANPLLVSTFGMESFLFILIFLALLMAMLQERWRIAGVCLGLLALARMEGVLAIPLCLWFAPRRRDGAAMAGCIAAVIAPWFLFAWLKLGSFVPDTLLIKQAQRPWWDAYQFHNGPLLYLKQYGLLFGWAFLFLPVCALAMRKWDRTHAMVLIIAGGYALLHYSAYSLLKVPPYHWYYTSEIMAATVCGTMTLSRIREAWTGAGARPYWLFALIVIYPAWLAWYCAQTGLPLREAPIHTNSASAAQYREIALRVRNLTNEQDTVLVTGEVGTLAYYSDRHLIEVFAERRQARGLIDALRQAKGLRGALARFNFMWLRLDSAPIEMPAAFLFREPEPPPASAQRYGILWRLNSRWMKNALMRFVTREEAQRAGKI
jgi:hypothetical protein